MANEKQPPSGHKGADDFPHQVDARLKKLFKMTPSEILAGIQAASERRSKARKEIDRLTDRLTARCSLDDWRAVKRVQQMQRVRLLPHPLYYGVSVHRTDPEPVLRVRAKVIFHGNRDDLMTMGLKVHSQAHDFFTISGTLEQLAELARQPATWRLSLPRPMPAAVEDAIARAEIPEVHSGDPGYEGAGVIVGIIDTALDVSHHAFRLPDPDEDGFFGTRVLYYWVQFPDDEDQRGSDEDEPRDHGYSPQRYSTETSGSPDFSGLDYGCLYDRDYIDKALRKTDGPYGDESEDISCDPDVCDVGERKNNHGTAVASVAVGNGRESGGTQGPHIGAAPCADIVFVSNTSKDFSDADESPDDDRIADGVSFILKVAEREQKPVVINISRGNQYGCHQGWSDLAVDVDNVLGSYPDRFVVFPTGNDNALDADGRGVYTHGLIPGQESAELDWKHWGAGPALYISLAGGGPLNCVIRDQASAETYDFTVYSEVSDHRTPSVGDYELFIEASPDIPPLGLTDALDIYNIQIFILTGVSNGSFTIELRNDGDSSTAYHAWACPDGDFGSLGEATNNTLTLNETACCRSALSVGACAKEPVGAEEITGYSGAGPTLDGRMKPEIVAVGGIAQPGTDFDPVWVANNVPGSSLYNRGVSGTSFAAPVAAGAVALLLENARAETRALWPDTIKALLTQYASLERHEDRNRYGYGRLRLNGPVQHMASFPDIDVWVRTAEDDFGQTPYPGRNFACSPDLQVFGPPYVDPITELVWGTESHLREYDVRFVVHNLGIREARGVTAKLYFTNYWVAPARWWMARAREITPDGEMIVKDLQTEPFDLEPLSQTNMRFRWHPIMADLDGAEPGRTHACLLLVVSCPGEDAIETAVTDWEGRDGEQWASYIKNNNNVALRNLWLEWY